MLISIAQAQIFFLALTRILAILIHVPVLGGRSVPTKVTLGLGILLTLVMLPWQPLPAESAAIPLFTYAVAIAKELLIGTLAGFAAVMIFAALQITGHLMSLGSGFSAGQILNPALEESGSAIDQVYLLMAMLIFLVINGHHIFLQGLEKTFELVPVNTALPDLSLERLIALTTGMIGAGVQMSLPLVGTLLLADVTLGLLSRVAPQVQVFFLGVPLKVGVGLLVLSMALTILLPALDGLLRSIGPRTLDLLGA